MIRGRPAVWALAAAIGATAVSAVAQTARVDGLSLTGAWIRATPEGASTAAAYLTVTNSGPAADRLLGGAARGVREITPHTMSMSGGIMRMRALPGGLTIPPRATVRLSPGGDHLMLTGLAHGFRPGAGVPVQLRFARAGEVTVRFPVLAGAPGPASAPMRMP